MKKKYIKPIASTVEVNIEEDFLGTELDVSNIGKQYEEE